MAAGLLSCFGEQKAARRLRTGFIAWSYANDVKHDKTLFFSVRNVLALERLLAPEEREAIPLVWRGNWIEYGNTYMAGVCRLFMGLPIPPSTPQLPHNFVYIPYVLIAEDQLPPLAGTRRAVLVVAPPGGPVPAATSAADAAVTAPPQAAPVATPELNGEREDGLQKREEMGLVRAVKAVQPCAASGVALPLKTWTGPAQVELAGVTSA
ncbi:hypothetical protein Vafri_964 [Volvox africanus]|nr:hypothetical protein Vafri_964 [Volvox africanus]